MMSPALLPQAALLALGASPALLALGASPALLALGASPALLAPGASPALLAPGASSALLAPLAEAAPAPVDVGGAAWRLLLILLVLVAVLVVFARYGRQWLARISRTPPGELEVRAVCPLEPRRALYLVRLRNRDYLIASSEAGLSLLRELELDAKDAGPPSTEDAGPPSTGDAP